MNSEEIRKILNRDALAEAEEMTEAKGLKDSFDVLARRVQFFPFCGGENLSEV